MIDFDIEKFVRKYMTGRAESLLAADFTKFADEMHARIDGKRMLVIGGAGTIGSNYVKAALRGFKPAAMYVVDIDENQLTELTRELWYLDHFGFWTDMKLIFLTAWVIVFPKSKLMEKMFKDLPKPVVGF